MKRRAARTEDWEEEEESEEEEVEGSDEEGHDREAEIRSQLADVPFETLLRAQQRQAAAAARTTTKAASKQDPTTSSSTASKAKKKKRVGDAPTEMSSARPVSWVRDVVPAPRAAVRRDPRFDNLSGSYNKGLFRASYRFLDELRVEDEQQLREQIADLAARAAEARELADSSPDDEDAAELASDVEKQLADARRALAVLQRQRRAEDAQEKQAERKRALRKLAASSVARGKGAFFMKRAHQRRLEAVQAYKELRKKAGKEGVERFLAKHDRRVEARARKRGPGFRVRHE